MRPFNDVVMRASYAKALGVVGCEHLRATIANIANNNFKVVPSRCSGVYVRAVHRDDLLIYAVAVVVNYLATLYDVAQIPDKCVVTGIIQLCAVDAAPHAK